MAVSDEDNGFRADYLVAWQPPAALLDQQSALKGIVNLGAGVDALLANPSLPRGVPIVKLRGRRHGRADHRLLPVRRAVFSA